MGQGQVFPYRRYNVSRKVIEDLQACQHETCSRTATVMLASQVQLEVSDVIKMILGHIGSRRWSPIALASKEVKT